MSVIADVAIMLDHGAGVDEHVTSDPRCRLDDRARHDLRPRPGDTFDAITADACVITGNA